MTLSDADLRALLDLEAKATPGPWRWEFEDKQTLACYGPGGLEHHVLWAQICKACADRDAPCTAPNRSDQDLIAAARNAVRPLVEEVIALRTANDAVQGALTVALDVEQQRYAELATTRAERDRYRDALTEAVWLLRKVRETGSAPPSDLRAFLAKHGNDNTEHGAAAGPGR